MHACAEVEPSSTDILIWSDRQAEKAFARWLREKRREEMVKRRTEPTCDQLKEEQKVPALRRLPSWTAPTLCTYPTVATASGADESSCNILYLQMKQLQRWSKKPQLMAYSTSKTLLGTAASCVRRMQ